VGKPLKLGINKIHIAYFGRFFLLPVSFGPKCIDSLLDIKEASDLLWTKR
jgi:hypothetical protein